MRQHKIKSGITFLIVSAMLLLFANINTFAEEKKGLVESGERYSIVSVGGIEMLRDSVEREYIMNPVLSDGTKISLQEYKNMREASDLSKITKNSIRTETKAEKEIDETTQPFGVWWNEHDYDEWNGGTYLAPAEEVATAFSCHGYPNEEYCSIAVEDTVTTTESWQANVETGWKDAIKIGASYSWAKSATSSATYTHPIPPGYTASMYFEPEIAWSSGEITTTTYWNGIPMETSTAITSGEGPMTLANGLHKGVFSLKFHY